MKCLVTGGAGCIGSSLVEKLLINRHDIVVIDNLSSGKKEHMKNFKNNENFNFIEANVLDYDLQKIIKKCDIVFHLSANPDIKYKEGDTTDEDLKQNTVATNRILDAMRKTCVKKFVFASSSAVYGEMEKPMPENSALNPISLYGASKAACEHMISAYCSMFGFQAWVYRFANVVGGKSRRTGTTVLTDFINRLKSNQKELLILGDGKQKKAYMTNEDCVDGMLFGFQHAKGKFSVFNLGPDDWIEINEIAKIVAKEMNVSPELKYTGGDRGWPGDAPISMLDTTKMKKLGWKPQKNSKQAIEQAVKELLMYSI